MKAYQLSLEEYERLIEKLESLPNVKFEMNSIGVISLLLRLKKSFQEIPLSPDFPEACYALYHDLYARIIAAVPESAIIFSESYDQDMEEYLGAREEGDSSFCNLDLARQDLLIANWISFDIAAGVLSRLSKIPQEEVANQLISSGQEQLKDWMPEKKRQAIASMDRWFSGGADTSES